MIRSWQIDQGIEVDWRNRVSSSLDYTEEYKLFENDCRNRKVSGQLGYNTREYQSVQVGYEFGRNFGSDDTLWSGALKRKLTGQLSLECELQRLTLTPDPDLEGMRITTSPISVMRCAWLSHHMCDMMRRCHGPRCSLRPTP